MKLRTSVTAMLAAIAEISDKQERRDRLREACQQFPPVALIIQYTYHPAVQWDLPDGPFPERLVRKSTHDNFVQTFTVLRRLRNVWKGGPASKEAKESVYKTSLETVVAEDIPLIEGMRMKKLPWKPLNKPFCVKALPELFPEVIDADVSD